MNNPILMGDYMETLKFSRKPGTVHGQANAGTQYYKRVLYNKLYSRFKFTLPESWKLNWFRSWLFRGGCIAVIYTSRYGWIINPFSVTGWSYQYNPAEILCVNAYLGEGEAYKGVIGLNSEIIKSFDDYYGFDDIVSRYAVMLADADAAININLMNSRTAWIATADDKKQADTLKLVLDEIGAGNTAVAVNKKTIGSNAEGINIIQLPVKSNYVANDIIIARQSIMDQFCTEVGIANANTEKKERLLVDEVNSNNDETQSLIEVAYQNIKKSIERVKALPGFDLPLDVERGWSNAADDIIWSDSMGTGVIK